ncbi:MAG TPA: VOC family protein [Candidatus Limnocylindrales bacterium]|nr:VOC family protein [Candidatus Limnocylindrales bacterium]
MTVPARISIVTIGVADVTRSVAFYERLGWERCASSMDEIAWFRTADSYLGIFGWNDLAEDANLKDASRGGFGGITLAINVETKEMVDEAIAEALAAGGSVLKPGTELPFGYGGYFADPDGHPWEVCYNAGFPFGPDGRIRID